MRKILILILSFILLFSLVACNSKQKEILISDNSMEYTPNEIRQSESIVWGEEQIEDDNNLDNILIDLSNINNSDFDTEELKALGFKEEITTDGVFYTLDNFGLIIHFYQTEKSYVEIVSEDKPQKILLPNNIIFGNKLNIDDFIKVEPNVFIDKDNNTYTVINNVLAKVVYEL